MVGHNDERIDRVTFIVIVRQRLGDENGLTKDRLTNRNLRWHLASRRFSQKIFRDIRLR